MSEVQLRFECLKLAVAALNSPNNKLTQTPQELADAFLTYIKTTSPIVKP